MFAGYPTALLQPDTAINLTPGATRKRLREMLDTPMTNFAGQVLACLAAWSSGDYRRDVLGMPGPVDPIPEDRLNLNGGAISIGHPVGASGARLLLHLALLLKRLGVRRGIASLCIGGGQGGAMLLEGDQS